MTQAYIFSYLLIYGTESHQYQWLTPTAFLSLLYTLTALCGSGGGAGTRSCLQTVVQLLQGTKYYMNYVITHIDSM